MSDNHTNRRPSSWEVVQEFYSNTKGCNLAIYVRRDTSVRWPKFSCQVGELIQGRDGNDSYLRPHLSMRVDRVSVGNVTLRTNLVDELWELTKKVQDYILSESNKIEQDRVDGLVQRDTPKPVDNSGVMRKGKTERDRAKKGKRKQERQENWR